MDENCGARVMLIMQHKTDNARSIMKQHWKCQTDHTYVPQQISICFFINHDWNIKLFSQKICRIDFSCWIAPQILATPTGQKSRSPNFQFVWRTFAKNPLFSPSKGCLCSWAKSLEGAGGCLEVGGGWKEVGWYWIVLEGEERGCGGVYHPWG